MGQILDPAAEPRQRSFDSDRQPPPRHHVAHGEPDQDGEPEEAAARDHPGEPRALAQVHEEEDDEDRLVNAMASATTTLAGPRSTYETATVATVSTMSAANTAT